jgi:hypothetical protein
MKVIGERLERPDWFGVSIRANGCDVHFGTVSIAAAAG